MKAEPCSKFVYTPDRLDRLMCWTCGFRKDAHSPEACVEPISTGIIGRRQAKAEKGLEPVISELMRAHDECVEDGRLFDKQRPSPGLRRLFESSLRAHLTHPPIQVEPLPADVEAMCKLFEGPSSSIEEREAATMLRQQADLLAERAASIAYQNQRIVTLMAAPVQPTEPVAWRVKHTDNEGRVTYTASLTGPSPLFSDAFEFTPGYAHPPTSEWNEGVVMQHAITQLEIALATVENNAPINEAEGKVEQAQYERECADSYRAAIAVLKR